jgi:hypothetical protein
MRNGLKIVKKIGLQILAYIGGSFKYIQFKRNFNRNLISRNIYSPNPLNWQYLLLYNHHRYNSLAKGILYIDV